MFPVNEKVLLSRCMICRFLTLRTMCSQPNMWPNMSGLDPRSLKTTMTILIFSVNAKVLFSRCDASVMSIQSISSGRDPLHPITNLRYVPGSCSLHKVLKSSCTTCRLDLELDSLCSLYLFYFAHLRCPFLQPLSVFNFFLPVTM
jgi:hypothetical protein